MLLKLYQAGQPVLRKKAKPVNKETLAKKTTQDLIDFMISTLRDSPGVGLAAPQVGESLRIIIVEDKASYHEQVPKELLLEQQRKPVPLKVFVNPVIEIVTQDEALYFEGCLSVEGYVGAVPRATKVKLTALDRKGKPIERTASGWYARILQHEIGHLNGELYIDIMRNESFMNQKNFVKFWRKATQEKIAKTFKK